MNDRFRRAALALRDHISDTYALLAAADDVVALVESEVANVENDFRPVVKSPDGHATYNWTTRLWDYDHAYLVDVCRNDGEILRHVRDTKKINAIKRLRATVPGAGLKACKEAVEDSLVGAAAALFSDPWSSPHDEPPF